MGLSHQSLPKESREVTGGLAMRIATTTTGSDYSPERSPGSPHWIWACCMAWAI